MIGKDPSISTQDYLDFMIRISRAETQEDILTINKECSYFKHIFYHHPPAPGAENYHALNRYWTLGLSDEILRYFESKLKSPDPVLKYVFKQARPYWLSDLLNKEEFSSGKAKHRVDIALRGIGDGLLAPLYGPYQRTGYIFIGLNNPREFYDDIFIWQAQSILQALHIRYCMIVEALRRCVKLTPREGEVLELLSFGKTNPEIGLILGISTSTVTGHVKRIFLKLDVKDRVSAAMRTKGFNL